MNFIVLHENDSKMDVIINLDNVTYIAAGNGCTNIYFSVCSTSDTNSWIKVSESFGEIKNKLNTTRKYKLNE